MLIVNWNGIESSVPPVREMDYAVLPLKHVDKSLPEKSKKVALRLSEKQTDERISQTF